MFITEPFDGCHGVRDGDRPGDLPPACRGGRNLAETDRETQHFLHVEAIFDIL